MKDHLPMHDILIPGAEPEQERRLTIRYLGVTSGEITPWHRAFKKNLRRCSSLGMFREAVRSLFPECLSQQKIYAVKRSFVYLPENPGKFYNKAFEDLGDSLERTLVRLLDTHTSLNCQQGGKHIARSTDVDDESVFLRCRATLRSSLEASPFTNNQEMNTTVQGLFAAWAEYARENIWKKTEDKPSEEYLTTVWRQASPKQVYDTSLFAICGRDPPRETIRDASTFLEGERKAAHFIREILLLMMSIETGTVHSSLGELENITGFSQMLAWPDIKGEDRKRSLVRISTIAPGITRDMTLTTLLYALF